MTNESTARPLSIGPILLALSVTLWAIATVINVRWDRFLVENWLWREPAWLAVCIGGAAVYAIASLAPQSRAWQRGGASVILLLTIGANVWFFQSQDPSPNGDSFRWRPYTFESAGADPQWKTHFTVLPLYVHIRDHIRASKITAYAPVFDVNYLHYLAETPSFDVSDYDPELSAEAAAEMDKTATRVIEDYATGLTWRVPETAAPGGVYRVSRREGVHYLVPVAPGLNP